MAFGDLVADEKEFADLVLAKLIDEGKIHGTASHVIAMNVYDNGRMVYKGFDVVERKYKDPPVVEAEDVKIVMLRMVHGMEAPEYTEEERNKLKGLQDVDLTVDTGDDSSDDILPPGGGEGIDLEKAKEMFFSPHEEG